MKIRNGYEITEADEVAMKDLKKFKMFEKAAAKVYPTNYYLPMQYFKQANTLFDFKNRPEDVFVMSYPKVGSTWIQEIVWSIMHNRNLDHPNQNSGTYWKVQFFEMEAVSTSNQIEDSLDNKLASSMWDLYETMENPRIFKSHMYFDLINSNIINDNKIVYVIRDPFDVCFSFYNFCQKFDLYFFNGSLEEFVEAFTKGHVIHGSYVEHLLQWWKKRDHPNVYTVFYEDMKINTSKEIRKIADFLGVELTEGQVENVKQYADINTMRKRDGEFVENNKHASIGDKEDATCFYRKGQVGDSLENMTSDMINKIKSYMRENLQDMKLPYNFS